MCSMPGVLGRIFKLLSVTTAGMRRCVPSVFTIFLTNFRLFNRLILLNDFLWFNQLI